MLLTGIEARRGLGLPGGSVLFDAYGGAINSVAPGDTAFVHRDKLACLQYVAPWGTSASSSVIAANQSWLDGLYGQMRPYVSGFAYLNYIDAEAGRLAARLLRCEPQAADERQSGGRPVRPVAFRTGPGAQAEDLMQAHATHRRRPASSLRTRCPG